MATDNNNNSTLFALYRYVLLSFIIVSLILGSVGRFALDHDLKMYAIVHHFTNWSWTLVQLPFYSVVWLCETYHLIRWLGATQQPLCSDVYRRIDMPYMLYAEALANIVSYTMVLGDAVFVYVVVFTHTDAIAALWTVNGLLQIKVGDLIVGNELFHSMPVIFVLVYTLLFRERIRTAYTLAMDGVTNVFSQALFYAYLIVGAPMVPVVIYLALFDPMSVYGIHAPYWEALFVMFTSFAISTLPAVFFV